MDRMQATPRRFPAVGGLADFLAAGTSPQRTQQMRGLMEFLQVPDIAATLDRVSYGEPLTTGRGMTTQMRPETENTLMAALGMTPVGKPAQAGAMALGRAGERVAERVVPQVMERGGLPAEMLSAMAQGTQSQAARAGSKTADALLKKSELTEVKRIMPPHQVRDTEKLKSLVASMKKNGWQGRPILAFDVGNGLEALTGTHRLAAAKQAGIEDVPVLKISNDIGNYADEYGRSIRDISDEEDVLEYLKNFGDKDAFELMRAERLNEQPINSLLQTLGR